MEQLLELYRKYPGMTVGEAASQYFEDNDKLFECPLCKANDVLKEDCNQCPWYIMTGRGCYANKYRNILTDDRMIQLEEWLKEIEEE